jgi:hypothetical protein
VKDMLPRKGLSRYTMHCKYLFTMGLFSPQKADPVGYESEKAGNAGASEAPEACQESKRFVIIN